MRRSTPLLLTALLLALVGALLPVSATQAVGASTIRGTVLVTGGAPLAGAEVVLYARTGSTGTWESVAATTTDDAGAYVLSDVAPGTYRVGFHDRSGTYVDEYWDNFGTVDQARDLVVPDQPSDNINGVLAEPYAPGGVFGAITGTVTGHHHTHSVKVTAYHRVDGTWRMKDFIWTGFDGTYRLNLRAGTYRIGFTEEHNRLVPEFWRDAATVDLATDIVVLEDTVTPGKDATLTASPNVANLTPPTVSGTPQVGQTLTAAAGTWAPAPATYSYEWLADGVPVAGATGSQLQLTSAQLGQSIAVRVTASGPEGNPGTATSPATLPVAAAPIRIALANVSEPRIKGKAKVGKSLKVTSGTWTLPSDVSFTYQWLANGRRIKKATRDRLKVTAALVGKRLSVRITARTADATITVRTRPTSKVMA